MSAKLWRLKTRPQPLLFLFPAPLPLCAALARLSLFCPRAAVSASVYRGSFYLRVSATLTERPLVRGVVGPSGICLGPAPVLYAFFSEHGREIF